MQSMSVCLHQLGHALAYNGWRNGFDGSLPGNYASPFDQLVGFEGDNFWFSGPSTTTLTGGPVAVTCDNPFHFGNNPPRPGSKLIPQLMSGVVFRNGHRYRISELDWAVLADLGVAVLQPPASGPANITGGGSAGLSPDGIVDGSDFVAFINSFSTGDPNVDPLADLAGGGINGLEPDGIIDGSDFIAFINAFAAGC